MTIPTPDNTPDSRLQAAGRAPTDTELLSTLFELGREVTSVLDLEELLAKIPQLIARLTRFSAFSVYLLDERRQELRIAYAVGYPEEVVPGQRLPVGQGVVGAAVRGRAPDPGQRHSPGTAVQGPAAQHAVAARRADATTRARSSAR